MSGFSCVGGTVIHTLCVCACVYMYMHACGIPWVYVYAGKDMCVMCITGMVSYICMTHLCYKVCMCSYIYLFMYVCTLCVSIQLYI